MLKHLSGPHGDARQQPPPGTAEQRSSCWAVLLPKPMPLASLPAEQPCILLCGVALQTGWGRPAHSMLNQGAGLDPRFQGGQYQHAAQQNYQALGAMVPRCMTSVCCGSRKDVRAVPLTERRVTTSWSSRCDAPPPLCLVVHPSPVHHIAVVQQTLA